jgi:hypothetical protein
LESRNERATQRILRPIDCMHAIFILRKSYLLKHFILNYVLMLNEERLLPFGSPHRACIAFRNQAVAHNNMNRMRDFVLYS